MPVTAHPAFDKGAHYFGIELRKAAVTDQFVADMDSVRSLVDENTVALVGSAGTYPHGLIDPIDELSDLALERGINLHVDGCLGGFILAWGQDLGVPGAARSTSACRVSPRSAPTRTSTASG